MRKADNKVREVVCSETGKPMPKIPLWMADIKVKFISDESRQKNSTVAPILDTEPIRKGMGVSSELDELKELDAVAVIDDADADFDDPEAEAEEIGDDEDY